MQDLINLLIKQETQLLDRKDSLEVLADLVDDEFIEIGSSAQIFDKAEVIRWLNANEQHELLGSNYQAKKLAENIILLNYQSTIKDKIESPPKKAMRSSIWRFKENKWRMIFHQGTPIK